MLSFSQVSEKAADVIIAAANGTQNSKREVADATYTPHTEGAYDALVAWLAEAGISV